MTSDSCLAVSIFFNAIGCCDNLYFGSFGLSLFFTFSLSCCLQVAGNIDISLNDDSLAWSCNLMLDVHRALHFVMCHYWAASTTLIVRTHIDCALFAVLPLGFVA